MVEKRKFSFFRLILGIWIFTGFFVLTPFSAKAQLSDLVSISATALPPPRGSVILIPSTVLSFSGRAYPEGRIVILKNGQFFAETKANRKADFSVSLTTLEPNNYKFSIYGEDNFQLRSPTFNFDLILKRSVTTTISGIFLPPTIEVDKREILKGEKLRIFGQTVPFGLVTIVIDPTLPSYKVSADTNGIYQYFLDTIELDFKTYVPILKTTVGVVESPENSGGDFIVGQKTRSAIKTCESIPADLNCDGRVNLIDFSILLFWHKKTNFPARVNLDGYNGISLADLSVMIYYWSG